MQTNQDLSRRRSLASLAFSLVCLGMLIAYLTVGSYLAAFGCLMATFVFATMAARPIEKKEG